MQYVKFNRLLTKGGGGGGGASNFYFLFNGDGNISMPAAVLDNTKPNRVEYLLDRTDVTSTNSDIWGSDDTACYGRLREFDFRTFRAGAGANIVELLYARNVLYDVVETIAVAGAINVTMTPRDGGPILSGNVNVGLSTISVGLSIGNRIGGNGFTGVVSDFKIFDDTNTLIHHWPIDEGSGTVINDVVGGANGTLTIGTGSWIEAYDPSQDVLLHWYKKGVGQYQETTPITPSGIGDPVGLWQDQSGNGLDIIQASGAAMPTVQGDGSIYFDGSDVLAIASMTLDFSSNFDLCYRMQSGISYQWKFDDNATTGMFRCYEAGTAGRLYYATDGDWTSIPSVNVGSRVTIQVHYDAVAEIFTSYLDGVLIYTSVAFPGQNLLSFTGEYKFGEGYTGSSFMIGEMSEWFISRSNPDPVAVAFYLRGL